MLDSKHLAKIHSLPNLFYKANSEKEIPVYLVTVYVFCIVSVIAKELRGKLIGDRYERLMGWIIKIKLRNCFQVCIRTYLLKTLSYAH